MIIDSKVITFKGMPLFQQARFKPPMDMEGAIQDFACFFYMVEGTMLSYDSRGVHKLGEKEAVIKNCNNYIQRYIPTSGMEECEAIAIYLYPELLKVIYRDEVPSFLLSDEVPRPKKLIGNQLLEQYMNNLAIYFETPEVMDEELGILKLKELMMILLRSENHENIRQLLSEIFTPVNIQFRRTIEQNLFNALSMEQLAFICNMSLSTFKREFKKEFGESPARYIKNKRLEHAASCLLRDQGPIATIAYASGFQDITTFSSSFHQKFQVSPSAYRSGQIRK